MDPEAFLDLANQVAKLKMYPYFELAHAIVCCLTVKEDMSSGRRFTYTFARVYCRVGLFYRCHAVFEEAPTQLLVLLHAGDIRGELLGKLDSGGAVPDTIQKQQSVVDSNSSVVSSIQLHSVMQT